MSASQSPQTLPPASSKPPPKPIIRRRRVADPLVQQRRPPPKPTAKPGQPGAANGAAGARTGAAGQNKADQSEEEYEDIPIVTTRRALVNGMRHHVLRFLPNVSGSVQDVNLLDESQFQRPVRLHRRDPRANNWNHMAEDAAANGASAADKQVDDKERERLEALKAERRAEREALQAQTAPVSKKDATQPKKNRFKKHFDQAHTYSDIQEKKKNMTIRYEEKLPWHLEDFDDQNVWRGTYETALSDSHIALLKTGNVYHMVPLEKWYKFTPKNKFKALSFEEAESAMQKGAKDPLLLRKAQAFDQRTKQTDMVRGFQRAMFARKGERGEQPRLVRVKGEGGDDDEDEKPETAADIDDIDFNYDEDFADDEEGPELVGADEKEQAKETDDKVKREMREAPVFELREEKDYDAEEEEQKRKDAQERKHRKRVERALMRREKNFAYEGDSDENPFASDGDSDDSELERQNEEEAKQEEESKKNADGKGKDKAGDKLASGASTKGTSTPTLSSKASKPLDPLKKILKRPGSPSMSEASGNESSAARKKLKKKKQLPSSNLGDGGSISRPRSPASSAGGMAAPQAQRQVKISLDANGKKVSEGGAGSGSEVDMSDGSRSKRGRKRPAPTSSPDGSRPGSPGAVSNKKPRSSAPPPGPLPDSLREALRTLIPAEGVEIARLIRLPEVAPYVKHADFMPFMKAHVRVYKDVAYFKKAA